MNHRSEFSERLTDYNIEGDLEELLDLLTSDSMVRVSLAEIVSVLSKSGISYLLTACGASLAEAYENAQIKGKNCRLVFIYFSDGAFGMKNLYNFINAIGEDVIFGYAKNETISRGLKLVMIFN